MANLFDEIDKELAARSGSKNGNIIYRPNGKIDWYAMAKGSGANNAIGETNDTVGNGFLGHVVDSAQAGAAGSVGGFARFLEEFAPFGNEWMGELANDMDKVVRRNTPLQPLEGTDWVASALGNAIGSGIPSIVAGAAIIGAAGAVGAAVPASIAAGVVRARTAIPALGKIVTATKEMWKSPFGKLALTETAGSAFEGTTEAGNLITEMRDKGYTDEEIRQAAIASASMNTAWLTVANAIGGAITAKYGKEAVKGGLKQMAKNAGKGAALEGSSEAVQEYGQSLIGNVAEGTELDHEAAKEAAAQAFVGSGILGGFGGAMAPYINNNTTNSQPNPNTVDEQEKLDDSGAEDVVTETDTTTNPDLEQARNEIIGYRETFNEDDAEFGRLTELLENGNDEEIIAEAQAIRGVKPEEQVATPEEAVPQQEEVVEEQTDGEELTGEAVEPDIQQTTSPVNQEQQETGGEENGETDLPPEGQNVENPENPSNNGQPQEDVATPPENQQNSEELGNDDLPPTFFDAADGLLTEKPKSKFQQAQEEIKTIKKKEQKERNDGANQGSLESVDTGVDSDEFGYKSSIGDYSTVSGTWNKEDYHRYENKKNKTIKALHKNTDGTYMVETITEDKEGNKGVNYATFSEMKDAEDFIASGKSKTKTGLKTYWASVRDSKNKIKIIKMAYPTKSAFKQALKDGGYRVRVIAAPDKFEQEVIKFNNRVEDYNAGRKAKKEASKNLKANLTVIEAKENIKPHTIVDEKRRLKVFDNLVSMLRKSGIKVYTSPEDLAKAAQSGHNGSGKVERDGTQVYIVNSDGKKYLLNGLADKDKGVIYLNRNNIRLDVPIHEYTHIWSQILRETNPELWERGIELMKQTPMWNEIKNNEAYTLRDDNAIADEVLAWLAGNNGADIFAKLDSDGTNKSIGTKLRKWLKEFWSALKSFFEVHGEEKVKELSLEEFINMPLKDFANSKTIDELRNKAEATSTAKTVFDKYAPDRDLPFYEQKLNSYLETATKTVREAFKDEKIRKHTVEVAGLNPKLYEHKAGEETYHYVSYDGSKGTRKISASVFKALRTITGVDPKPYKVKSEAVKEGKTPQESILTDDDIKGFVKQIVSTKKKFSGKEEQIENLLGLTDEDNGKTIAEQLREAAAKDLPEAGKENDEEAFFELDFEWVDNNFVDELAYDYYAYLINKYQTKTGDQSAMLVPVKDDTKVAELEKRLKAGENRLTIWEETGWYKAKDGQWKYFIDDDLDAIDLSKILKNGVLKVGTTSTLGELYNNPQLYKEFPYLKNIKVEVGASSVDYGTYDKGVITIYENQRTENEYKRTLLHEAEHAVQNHEGMAVGSSPEGLHEKYDKTVDALLAEAMTVSDEAAQYFDDAATLIEVSVNPFNKILLSDTLANARKNVRISKKAFNRFANDDEKALLERIISTLQSTAKKIADRDSDFDAYASTLGEEEARMVMFRAKQSSQSLSPKDVDLYREIVALIKEMPDKTAVLATNYLYQTSSFRGNDTDFAQTEGLLRKSAEGKAFLRKLDEAESYVKLSDSLAHLDFIMGHDDRSIVFLGNGGKALSVEAVDVSPQDTLLARGTKAVVTKKPKSVSDDIKANGYKGFAKQMFRKFYRSWVDKNIDIKDFDAILSNALGRALTAAESVYNKVQIVSSNAAGLTTALINGNADHISAANSKLDRKKMKYKVTLATVLDMVNAKVMQPYDDYLKASGCDNWIEAFGAYLGWRRLAEMARLKRLAFNEEHAEWADRKRAYDAWANSGRIGKNPLLEEYEAWEAYQKNLKNAKRRWERAGKVGVNPVEALKAEWLATHKDEETPKRFVGKEPVFEEYKMPQGLTEQEVNQLIKQAPAPFAKAAKHYYMLNDNILSIMEDAGLIDVKTHELLNEKYKDYCPMIRDFSDTAAVDAFIESITAGGKGVGNVSSMLKKISEEGSERTIINPLESTIQTIAAVSNRAERNKAGQHLVRMMSKAEDLKGYIRKLEQPKHGSIQADPKNCVFTIMFNGKKVAYQADPEYYNAIVGYNMPTSSLLLRVPQTFAQCLRTGATMSPSFIVRNVFRDTITAGIASKNGFIPIIDTIRGAKALWSDPEFRAKFEASGVVAFNQFGSAESAYNNLTDLASGKNYTVYEPVDIIKGVLQAVFKGNLKEALKTTGISLEQLSSYAESATRAGEFKKALEAGKSINEASYDAKEVTLNFSRSGVLGQEWNRVVPFFNACIQGGDKMMRLFYEDPKGTSLKVAQYIVLPSLALWALNHDEDWYEELDPQIKYTHWCLPNGIRVPKPQEYGILFGGSIEAMLDTAVLKDPKAMSEVAKGIRDTVTPSVMPTIVLPLIEWITNYSFFKGRDLVPQRLQRMPDELQYSTGTSELSKFIGKHTYFSPIKIDNVVRGYTGTMGTFLWQTPDWFAAEKQGLPAKEVNEMQFIRDFNVTEANRTRFLNDFYELQDKANKQQAGYGVKGKPNGAVKAIRKAGKVINDLNKQIRIIEMSDKYTPERKRELIDKKRERINSTAKFVVKKYGELF